MNHLLAITVALTTLVTGQWPAFLGSGATPKQPDRLPLQWTPTENIAWRTTLDGHGQSSPVIWENRVFVTGVEGPQKDTYYTFCVDLSSGKLVWKNRIANSVPVANSYYVSRAAPTPVVDQNQVISLFESGDCVAYDHDGNELWRRGLGVDEGPLVAEFGLGASPCQSESMLFVLLEHDGPSCLVALDKKTGETAWKAKRDPRRSWSSPAIISIDGTQQVVVSSAGTVDGYQADTGELLWSFDDIGGNTGTTPIDLGGGRFLVGASPGRNGENAASAVDSNCLMQVTRDSEGNWTSQRRWVAEGATPSWASPIAHDSLAYWVNRTGVVHCFDLSTGENVYTQRTKQSCWATPYASGDRIYFFGKDGLVTVIASGRQFKVLAENQSWDDSTLPEDKPLAEENSEERRRGVAMFSRPTLYGAAVADGTFVLRVGNCLICVR